MTRLMSALSGDLNTLLEPVCIRSQCDLSASLWGNNMWLMIGPARHSLLDVVRPLLLPWPLPLLLLAAMAN